jgi:signal transduction histidine kinase
VFGAAVAAVAATAPFSGASTEKAFTIALALAVGLLAGLNRRAFRVRAEQNAVLLTQAEELRAEQRRGAVLDERARIAREIHDILAHSLGALGIQIQAARALIGDHGDTARAQEVLDVAQRLAADGLADTRRAVHALRTDTLPLPDELAAMARAHRERHGCEVTVRVDGEPSPLPADQAVALVRTAQEALVNAAKYAPGRPVGITLAYSGDDVTMTVGNLLGASAPGTFTTVNGGYGLTGIRERLLLLGGTLCVGREPDGGGERWTLAARVPR